MTSTSAEPNVKERVFRTAGLVFDDDCALIAFVIDRDGNIILFSNGTGSKAMAKSVLKKQLHELGPDVQEAELVRVAV